MPQLERPSTVVVGCAGGYIHYRLDFNSKVGKVVVEESIHDFDNPESMEFREIERHDTAEQAWDAVGKKVGWLQSPAMAI